MKILLIGKNGQVGAEIERLSHIRGHKIFAFDRKSLDITKYSKVKQLIKKVKPEVVINTAAYHVVSDCEKYPEKSFRINAFAVKNLADLCNENKIRLVYYSTSWVFDGIKGPYKEESSPEPIQIYGLSKLAGEIISLNYNSQSIVIRTCGVFGGIEGSRSKKGNFVLYILDEATKKRSLEISSDQITSVAYAKDLALSTLELLEKDASHGVYNLVNEGYCSWSKFAEEIVDLAGLNLKIIPINRGGVFKNVRVPRFTSLKNIKAKSLGIVLPPWTDALKRYLDEVRKLKY